MGDNIVIWQIDGLKIFDDHIDAPVWYIALGSMPFFCMCFGVFVVLGCTQ